MNEYWFGPSKWDYSINLDQQLVLVVFIIKDGGPSGATCHSRNTRETLNKESIWKSQWLPPPPRAPGSQSVCFQVIPSCESSLFILSAFNVLSCCLCCVWNCHFCTGSLRVQLVNRRYGQSPSSAHRSRGDSATIILPQPNKVIYWSAAIKVHETPSGSCSKLA